MKELLSGVIDKRWDCVVLSVGKSSSTRLGISDAWKFMQQWLTEWTRALANHQGAGREQRFGKYPGRLFAGQRGMRAKDMVAIRTRTRKRFDFKPFGPDDLQTKIWPPMRP